MAYRQLAEDYKTKLQDANNRILELEGAVADLQANMEQSKQIASTPPNTDELTEARLRIADLENSLIDYKTRLEQVLLSTNDSTTRQELATANRRIQQLEHSLAKQDDWTAQLDRISKENTGGAAVELMNLRRQLESARSDEYALREEVEKLKATEAALREQLAGNGADVISSEVYRGRLDNAAALESALRTQAKNWERKTGKAEGKIEKAKAEGVKIEAHVKLLKASLQKEKDARSVTSAWSDGYV